MYNSLSPEERCREAELQKGATTTVTHDHTYYAMKRMEMEARSGNPRLPEMIGGDLVRKEMGQYLQAVNILPCSGEWTPIAVMINLWRRDHILPEVLND